MTVFVSGMARAADQQTHQYGPSRAVTLAAIMVLIAVFASAQGLTYPLLSIILKNQEVPAVLIGLNTAMTPLGLIVSAPLIPVLARAIGAARLALVSIIVLAILLAVIGAFQNLWMWFPARFLLGFAINGLYVTSETWVNQLATDERRGRILGLFSSCLSIGFALGPFIIVAFGSQGWPPFVAGIVLVSCSAAVLLPVMSRLPTFDGEEHVPVASFLPLAPLLLVIVAIAAAFDQGTLSLLPVYGLSFGLGEKVMATAIGVMVLGNIVLQVPIGWIADVWSQRGALLLLCALAVTGSVLLPYAIMDKWLLWPLLFLWSAAGYGVYTLALIELGRRFSGSILLTGNAAFAVMWGAGGIVGPTALGSAMSGFGSGGFPAVIAALYAGLFIAIAVRRR